MIIILCGTGHKEIPGIPAGGPRQCGAMPRGAAMRSGGASTISKLIHSVAHADRFRDRSPSRQRPLAANCLGVPSFLVPYLW